MVVWKCIEAIPNLITKTTSSTFGTKQRAIKYCYDIFGRNIIVVEGFDNRTHVRQNSKTIAWIVKSESAY